MEKMVVKKLYHIHGVADLSTDEILLTLRNGDTTFQAILTYQEYVKLGKPAVKDYITITIQKGDLTREANP